MVFSHDKQGLSLLLVVVVVGAAAASLIISANMLGIGEASMTLTREHTQYAQSIADGCADEALEQLRKSTSFVSSSLSVGDGSCILSVSSLGGDAYTVHVTSTYHAVTAVTTVMTTATSSQVIVTDWQ